MKICQFCPAVMHFSPRLSYAESFAYILIIFFFEMEKRRKYIQTYWLLSKLATLPEQFSIVIYNVPECMNCINMRYMSLIHALGSLPVPHCDNTCEIYVTVMWWYKVYIPGVCGFISTWRICNKTEMVIVMAVLCYMSRLACTINVEQT